MKLAGSSTWLRGPAYVNRRCVGHQRFLEISSSGSPARSGPAYGGVLHRSPQTGQITCYEPDNSFTPDSRCPLSCPWHVLGVWLGHT